MIPRKAWSALIIAWAAVAAVATPLLGQEDQYYGLWESTSDGAGFSLYRAVLRYRARADLRAAGILPEEFRAKEDSLGLRSDRLDDFIVLQDSLGLGWMPPYWIEPRNRNDLTDQVTVDLDSSRVEQSTLLRGKPLSPPVKTRMADYLSDMTRRNYRSIWASKAQEGLLRIDSHGPGLGTGLVNISLPVQMPRAIQGIVGEGKPNLVVRGSERITFAGTSRWYPDQPITEFQQKQSKFPQLEMKQELNLQLTGNIGDKVSVDVDQSSQAQTPLSNNIKIHYKGYQDEIIQKVDLGNTSLSLPGTQYVTYSGQQQGLFGINAQALVGDVEVTGIMSKQEGKNDTRTLTKGADIRTFTIEDYQYKHGKFFFLSDPDGLPLTEDGIGTLDQASVEVWVDDGNGGNDIEQGASPGFVSLTGNVQSIRGDVAGGRARLGKFVRLTNGDDYTIQKDVYQGYPILNLSDSQSLDPEMTKALAVRYRTTRAGSETRVGGSLGAAGDTLVLKIIRPSTLVGNSRPTDLTAGDFPQTAKLELRNVYDLGSNLSPDGLTVRIRRKKTVGNVTNPEGQGNNTFLAITGLDLYTESGENRIPGPDTKVDKNRIDYVSGYVMFRELQPFAPTAEDRRRRMGAPDPDRPDTLQDRAPDIYLRNTWTDEYANQLSKYQFEVTARSMVSTIALPAFNLLQGSEVVTAGNRTLTRDTDYTIDYDTGEIQILDAADVRDTDEIRVSYSYVPFGAGAQKTLMGTAFRFRPESSRLGLSSTWMYEGRGSPGIEGQRPRLGQEPTRTVVGEFAANYKTDSWFLTSLVDALPGVRTNQKSSFSIDSGLGLSFPNPNTRNQLYVDDFEGAKDVFSVQMNRTAWRPSGIPRSAPGATPEQQLRHHGECWWYSPRAAVKEGDLQPTMASRGGLADTEKDNNRQILELHYFPRGVDPASADSSWYSLVQPLSQAGTDLSRAQFLDIWINDFIPYEHRGERKGKLHIDIGTVSENAIWQKIPPQRLQDPAWFPDASQLAATFDTEDANKDFQLDLPSEGLGEDTGLDGNADTQELGYDPSANPDPADDDYSFEEGQDEAIRDLGGLDDPVTRDKLDIYAKINGTEKNGRLDSEDMNGNQELDTTESYFAFTIDLGDTSNVEYESSQAADQDLKYAPYTRGWRRVRIPLTAEFYQAVESPTWDQVRHMRIWLEGFDSEVRLQVGGIDITGNRWLKGPIRPDPPDSSFVLAPGEDFFPAVLNNKDNSTSEYMPPFKPKEQQNVEEREQSLTLEMRNFQAGHAGRVYRSFATPQDFASLYKTLEFYTNRKIREGPDPDSLLLFVRFARNASTEDENYYEYRVPVEDGWALRTIDLAEMSRIPLPDSAHPIQTETLSDGARISRKGNPSLTTVQRIMFGLINHGSTAVTWGNVWIDELRLTSVKRDTGMASRLAFSVNLADLGNLSLNLQRQDADFLRIGSDRGSGTTRTGISSSSRINLDKFFEGTGLKVPVNFTMSSDRQVPKFSTNSDLVLKKATDRDIRESSNNDVSFNISRSRSTNRLLRYTIDGVSMSGRFGNTVTNAPDSRNRTASRSGSVQYSLPLQGGPPIRVYKNTSLHLLPTNISVNVTGSQQKQTESRRRNGNIYLPYDPTLDLTTRTGGMSWSTGLRPIDAITYTFDQTRDLMLQQGLGGAEVSRRHQLSANQQVKLFNGAVVPKVSWTGSFDGRFNSLQSGSSIIERTSNFNNASTLTFSGNIPIDRLFKKLTSIGSGKSGGGNGKSGGGNGRTSGGSEGSGGGGNRYTPLGDSGDPGSPLDPGQSRDPGEPGGLPTPGVNPTDEPDTTGTPAEPAEPAETPERIPTRGEEGGRRGGGGDGGGGGGGGGIARWISFGALGGSYTIGATSSVSPITGEPSIPYQLGLTRVMGGSTRNVLTSDIVQDSSGYQWARIRPLDPTFSTGDRKDLNLTSEVRILSEIRIGTTYQRGYSRSSMNGGGSTSRTNRFPDLDINWGGIHRKLGIEKYAKDVRASTRYTRETRETGTSTTPKDRIETTISFRPLLNLDFTLNNGIATKLATSFSKTKTEQFTVGHNVSLTRNRQLQLNCRKTLSLTRMVTNPLTKKRSKVSSKLDLSATLDLQDNKRESGDFGNLITLEDRAKIALSTTAGYNITKNVTGNAGLTFGQDSDRKNKTRTARYVSVSVSAAFNF